MKMTGVLSERDLQKKGIKVIDKTIEIRFKEANDSIQVLNKSEKNTLSLLLMKLMFDIEYYEIGLNRCVISLFNPSQYFVIYFIN